jgi:hypothetical protein
LSFLQFASNATVQHTKRDKKLEKSATALVLGFTRRDTRVIPPFRIIFALHCTYLPEVIKASRQHSLRIAMKYA